MRQPLSGTSERIFMKLLPNASGEHVVSNVVTKWGLGPQIFFLGGGGLILKNRSGAIWRMLTICVIYAMTLAQSPEGATHGGCVIKS